MKSPIWLTLLFLPLLLLILGLAELLDWLELNHWFDVSAALGETACDIVGI